MRPLPLPLWLLLTAAQIEALEKAQAQTSKTDHHHRPVAVRKMPPDQNAKFHHEYCAFPEHAEHAALAATSHKPHAAIAARSAHEADDAIRVWANASAELPLRPAFALLSGSEQDEEDQDRISPPPWDLFRRAASALAFLEKRQWACPSGTSSCSAIGFPNSCCGEGETCMEVTDTGLGPVGCCPAGATCGGGISECAGGSTPCGSEIGGGCCIPGFVCQGVGCVHPSETTPDPTPEPTPSLTTLTTTSTSIISDPTPSTTIVTVIITLTPSTSPQPITSTVTRTSTASSPSSKTNNNGAGAGAPFRPTSSPLPSNTFCPTGFYPCLARAGGGCCQTGRDCATASCPPQGEMTTVVSGNGVTVVVPVVGEGGGMPEAATGGGCAGGWFMCEGGDGGEGCCPAGYACGTASCLATFGAGGGGAGATASVAKGLPGGGTTNRGGRVGVGVGWVFGMVLMGLVGLV